MNFQNVKIRTKLLIGFSIIAIMVIGLGWLAVSQSRSIWENTSNLYNHPFQVNIAVREIQTNIAEMHKSVKDVILSDNALEMSKYINEITQNEQKVYKNFEVVYALYLGQRSTVDSAFTAFSEWKAIRDSTIQLCLDGKLKEAAFRSTHSAEAYHDLMMMSVNKLRDFAMDKAETFYSQAERSKNQLILQLWLVMALFFLLTAVIAILILRSVTRPLQKLKAATEEHQLGNYDARCNIESTNEMGQLAVSFNRMADGIQAEIDIKNGLVEISDAMLGKEEFADFGRSILSALLSHTNSNLGAVYLLNEETQSFEPKFAIGLTNNNLRSFSATRFEGEFGRTLIERKITLITNIPEDSVFDFSTVTGVFKPREILNIPILLNEKVIAIISLASLNKYRTETLEMLRIAEKNLTAGLSSILAFLKIRDYTKKLDNQNSELEMQSKELRLQTEELHEQNAELEMQKRQIDEANRLKSEFLSSMSHELRTPLNAVIALSGVLNRKLKDKIPDNEYSYLEIIERNGKNLLTLINEILDLSRIEAGKAEIQLSTFSLQEAVGSILDTLHLQIEQKNILVVNGIEPDFPMIFTDRTKCHHILQNLIGNAVKFTDVGSVEISARIVRDEVHVSVKDTGIGISNDQLPHIFDQFHQIDGTASRKHEGTGLGLAIADKYSQLLGARIEVASQPGKGSEFTLIIPFTHADSLKSSESSCLQYKSSFDKKADPADIRHAVIGKTILIIEDSEPAIIQLGDILQDQGYLFKIARSGKEALALAEEIIPDAIILDLMMPGMDGFEVLEKIRGTEATSKIPVLILTAKYLNKSELKRLTANNIHQLVQKGDVGKDDLLNGIRSMIGAKIKTESQLSPTGRPVVKQGRITILLVEDNEDNVKTVEVLLAERFNLVVARDGIEGIEKARELNPDLILLDISLPLKDGFMVLEDIREFEPLADVPVIAVTARAMKGDKEHFLKYGFDDYISKPINTDLFEETLSKWILTLPMN